MLKHGGHAQTRGAAAGRQPLLYMAGALLRVRQPLRAAAAGSGCGRLGRQQPSAVWRPCLLTHAAPFDHPQPRTTRGASTPASSAAATAAAAAAVPTTSVAAAAAAAAVSAAATAAAQAAAAAAPWQSAPWPAGPDVALQMRLRLSRYFLSRPPPRGLPDILDHTPASQGGAGLARSGSGMVRWGARGAGGGRFWRERQARLEGPCALLATGGRSSAVRAGGGQRQQRSHRAAPGLLTHHATPRLAPSCTPPSSPRLHP
jgi:hypothetical protein